MNKISLNILLTVILILNTFAQKEAKPTLESFAGTWVLDEKKSFSDSKLKEDFEDFTLVISYKDAELKILQSILFKSKPSEYTVTLWTDKRGEDNTYTTLKADYASDSFSDRFHWLEDIPLKTKSYFKNGKIIREGSYKTEDYKYPYIFNETYSLSKDGKDLTISTKFTAVTTGSSFQREPSQQPNTSSSSYKNIFHKK